VHFGETCSIGIKCHRCN